MKAEVTFSEHYDVPVRLLVKTLGCHPFSVRRYVKRALIPEPKRRPGVRGKFVTEAQANKLLRLLGREERIHIES